MELREAFLASKLFGNGGGGGGGDGYTYDDIIEKKYTGVASGSTSAAIPSQMFAYASITGASFPNASAINQYAFNAAGIEYGYFPEATVLYANVFQSCYSLKTLDLQKMTSAGAAAFYGCVQLSSLGGTSDLKSIGNQCFLSCSELEEINLEAVTTLGQSAFFNCIKLKSANLLSFSGAIASNAFQGCYALSFVSAPLATQVSTSAFAYCSAIASINLPKVNTIHSSAFIYCSNISVAMLGNRSLAGTRINASAFWGCQALESVYLLWNNVPTTITSTCFSATPMTSESYLGHYGSIYVPASLVDSYKTKVGFSNYSARLVGLTDEEIAALNA